MKTGFSILPRLLGMSFGIFLIVIVFNWAAGYPSAFNIRLFYTFLFCCLYTFSLYFANALVFRLLDRKFAENRFSAKRIILGFLASFAVTLFVIFLLRVSEEIIIEGRTFTEFTNEERPANYIFAIVITFIVTLASYAFGFYKAYKENQVKEQQIIAGTASAQFESLKNQIDPHFLFNSLNVLSSLIEENPDQAQRFTTSLSKVYRYVLEQKDKELVSVSEELSFARTYMNLLKMRFENSLFYELPEGEIDPEMRVVPLSLQLLLENTVKHNVVSQERPLRIRIRIEGDYLSVENDLQIKEVLQDRKGVGLQNIVNRYAILTRRNVRIERSDSVFGVKIPILTKQVSIMDTHINEEQQSYLKAQKKVEDIKSFYGNLFSFLIINTGIIIINLVTTPQYLWFFYPLLGWGVGVIFHAMQVFEYLPFLGSNWEERKINEIMNKDKNNQWK